MTLSLTRNQPHKLPKAATCRVAMCQLDKQVPVDPGKQQIKVDILLPHCEAGRGCALLRISVPWPRGHSNLHSVSPLVPCWPPSLQCSTLSTKYHFKLQLLQSSREMNLALPREAESIIGGSSRARVGQPSSNPRAPSPLAECP